MPGVLWGVLCLTIQGRGLHLVHCKAGGPHRSDRSHPLVFLLPTHPSPSRCRESLPEVMYAVGVRAGLTLAEPPISLCVLLADSLPPGINQRIRSPLLGEPGAGRDAF